MICTECGSEMVESSQPFEEDFRGVSLTISGVNHFICNCCGEVVVDASEGKTYDKLLINAYRKTCGLLSPSEIRALRKQNGLNQQEFEQILGVSTPSVSRWETGKVPQSKPVDLLMRAYLAVPSLLTDRMEQVGIERRKLRKIERSLSKTA